MESPTTHSNWLIPGQLIVGAYPDPEGPFIEQLISIGVTAFISLQTTQELKKFRDYIMVDIGLN